TPSRIHCGLPTQALLFSHFGGWLQHRHLEWGHRETPNLILWLLGSSRVRCTEDDNCCSQDCRSHNQDLLFHGPTPEKKPAPGERERYGPDERCVCSVSIVAGAKRL